MYYYGLSAVPEWAPPDENHILRSSSVVKSVIYADNAVTYTTFDKASSELLRLSLTPPTSWRVVWPLPQRTDLSHPVGPSTRDRRLAGPP